MTFAPSDAVLAREAMLTILFVLLIYTLPGAFKAWLTVRTGNAWVHTWAYHASMYEARHPVAIGSRLQHGQVRPRSCVPPTM